MRRPTADRALFHAPVPFSFADRQRFEHMHEIGNVVECTMMTKLLKEAIDKVRELPEEDQEAVAAVMLQMARSAGLPVIHLDDETRAAVREGAAQADRGAFVPDKAVAEANKRHDL